MGLTRNEERIACEICVTTSESWELHNIEKCFASKYDKVFVCSTEEKALAKIRKHVELHISHDIQQCISYFVPEALFAFLDSQLAAEKSNETTIKGYRFKVEYSATTPNVMNQKKESILKSIEKSIRMQAPMKFQYHIIPSSANEKCVYVCIIIIFLQ